MIRIIKILILPIILSIKEFFKILFSKNFWKYVKEGIENKAYAISKKVEIKEKEIEEAIENHKNLHF